MSQVEFEEFNKVSNTSESTPKIVQWTVKLSGGLIKDERQAQYVLLGFSVIAIIFSSFLILGSGGNKPVEEFTISPGESIGSEQGIYRK
ncbi:hypothetical protein KKG48_00515 [Patescibacteria group bacterium]|nr:hypothetical protein [Patescibacteria group bacterium]MCG2694969.1 hypothetical protein [Candidatus Parcubacteria bacterium]